ncbi:sarcosine oxidase subunit alpha family protein [Salinarimonas sp.]|uniref:sarcosine oxidase subunit alpha family protein n=1 Tax=Salinarimonas sp. TaxID=2766526 RepID=UPI0032D93C71
MNALSGSFVAEPVGQSRRLPAGGLVDRTAPIAFAFDGRTYRGFSGDTLASALIASGVDLVGRSFKYHRPRGILTAGPEEPNALVELRAGARREPNTRATVVELFDGLSAASQNRWPSLRFDLMAANGLLSPVLGAGFYYKTFMWPAAFWEKVYEPLIRRAAGLGRAADAPDPDHYEKAIAFCDVLVIGSGPAGLAAALAAGRAGARVILAEEDFRFGGRLLAERREIAGRPATDWAADALAELASLPEVRLMPRTTIFGAYDHGVYGAVERVADHLPVPPPHTPRLRAWRIVAKRAVLAAGAVERPIVFPGNDRPGVMLASAARTYLNRFAVAPHARPVLFTTSDDGWRSAADLVAAGGSLAAIVDARVEIDPALVARAKAWAAELVLGGRVVATHGRPRVRAIDILDGSGRSRRVACDGVLVANGWNPMLALTCHQGARPVFDERIAAFVPGAPPPGMAVAGAAAGRLTLAEALADGARLGAEAAIETGFSARAPELPSCDPEQEAHTPLWRVSAKGRSKGKAFVDLQNDVTADDVALAHAEGFRAVEHLKRYTTLGMATDQGKTANVPGLAIMAELTGRSIPQTGTTMFRPPVTPVAIGALAGHHRGRDFRPTRLTPSHAWAAEQGAVFVESGPWLRAQYFPRAGERDWLETVCREVRTAREAVGVCDVSTLGKIDIQGADAAAFLDRVYANTFSTLAVGKARYGLMLREDGFVMDDGTTARLSDTHYVMTTTTANAAKVMAHLELCAQWHWPGLDVRLASVTEAWAQFSVAGPRSRDTLRGVVDPGHDLSDEALPYMGARAVSVGGGIPARIFRLSFSGERAYEIAVPAQYGDAAIRAIAAAGAPYGIAPYGTEALGVMRIEKGHAAGPELDGRTTAHDLGLGRMVSKKKDFVGRALAARPALTDPGRASLVGLVPVEAGARLRAGAHIVPEGVVAGADTDQGWVTSVAFSPTLGHWIGLAMVENGPARHGEIVRAVDPVRDGDTPVRLTDPVFVDKEGVRLHA